MEKKTAASFIEQLPKEVFDESEIEKWGRDPNDGKIHRAPVVTKITAQFARSAQFAGPVINFFATSSGDNYFPSIWIGRHSGTEDQRWRCIIFIFQHNGFSFQLPALHNQNTRLLHLRDRNCMM
jgi:hypothetical protein